MFIVTAAVVILLGLVLRDFAVIMRVDREIRTRLSVIQQLTRERFKANDSIDRFLLRAPRTKKMRQYLKELTSTAHLAGTDAQAAVAEYVQNVWKSHGHDVSSMENYSVYLSLPDEKRRNRVDVINQNDGLLFAASDHEDAIPGSAHQFTPPFNAFSPAGNATGQILYCNRCTQDDFAKLRELHVPLGGRICLCRYTPTMEPGNQAWHAGNVDIVGVLLFLDPQDVAPDPREPVFPNTWWMPGNAIRRSTMRYGMYIGDLTTQGYASRADLPGLYRDEQILEDMGSLSQPIGYKNAEKIMKSLQGQRCPDGWAPKFAVTCVVGDANGIRARMFIYNKIKKTIIRNVIGYITGAVEPDRYVVLGVPIDAWSTGAAAPATAVVQALELSRIFKKLKKKKKWNPGRTIVFAGWDAHQLGHIGATEFVEGHRTKLMSRTVLYINSDMCASGKEFMASSSPTLAAPFSNVTKLVPWFKGQKEAYHSIWRGRRSSAGAGGSGKPELPLLRADGSHLPFVRFSGLPSVDISFGNDHSHNLYYPAYGTGYDTFDLVDHFVDPGFKVQKTCAQLMALMVRHWADVPLLPYDLMRLSERLYTAFDAFERQHAETLKNRSVDVGPIRVALGKLGKQVDEFRKRLREVSMEDPLETRRFNDMLLSMERAFLQLSNTATDKPVLRNVVFDASGLDPDRMIFFPALDEMVTDLPGFSVSRKEDIELEVASAAYALQQAADIIDPQHVI